MFFTALMLMLNCKLHSIFQTKANSSSVNVQHSEILSTVNRCHLPENTALGNTLTNAELCDDCTVEVIL
jgi:hypothetical protein